MGYLRPRQQKQTPLLSLYIFLSPWKQGLTESIPLTYRCLIAPYCIFKLSFVMRISNVTLRNYKTFIKQFPFFEKMASATFNVFSCARHLKRAAFSNKCRATICATCAIFSSTLFQRDALNICSSEVRIYLPFWSKKVKFTSNLIANVNEK